MDALNIKDLVRDTRVRFLYYRKGELWYEVVKTVSKDNEFGGKTIYPVQLFTFPVPIEDTGDGTFNAEDKAILFMRYIRKQLDKINNEIQKL